MTITRLEPRPLDFYMASHSELGIGNNIPSPSVVDEARWSVATNLSLPLQYL